MICDDIAAKMHKKIARLAPCSGSRFRWPIGDGESRAAFCRKMAKLCVKKKRKVK